MGTQIYKSVQFAAYADDINDMSWGKREAVGTSTKHTEDKDIGKIKNKNT